MKQKITISHSKTQNKEVNDFLTYLQQLVNYVEGVDIIIRSKLSINPGDRFLNVIHNDLIEASIIFCLIDKNYLVNCKDEIDIIENLYKSKNVRVIPIIIGECLWDMTFFREISPIDIKSFNDIEQVWESATSYLRSYIEEKINLIESKIEEVFIAPYKAVAGKSTINSEIREVTVNAIQFKNQKKGDIIFEIEGNSMSPFVNEGDYVLCRKCKNLLEIIDDSKAYKNKKYVLETFTRGFMLKTFESDGEYFILKSENNKEHPNFSIKKSDIKSYWKVIEKANFSQE